MSAPSSRRVLDEELAAELDTRLAGVDAELAARHDGVAAPQPVHTVYVPADSWHPGLPGEWGERALTAVERHGGMQALAERVLRAAEQEPGLVRTVGSAPDSSSGTAREQAAAGLAEAVTAKLHTEPIEDLRLDFEDGFGDRSDEDEDHWAAEAGRRVGRTPGTPAPRRIGLRIKCFEAPVRRRALRTLDLFVAHVLENAGTWPRGLVITLPKVSTPEQVTAMVEVCRRLERAHGLGDGVIGFEVQVETPRLILGPDGTVPLAAAVRAGEGRVTGLHYGTFDYSAALGVPAEQQAPDHPVADVAKHQMLLAASGTGVEISDGSTNVLPVGDDDAVLAAWDLHAALVRRQLQHGIRQGWDMHPHHLPTRHLATFHFFRRGFGPAAARLRAYARREHGAVLDEPATAMALAGHIRRGLDCGALAVADLERSVGIDRDELEHITRTGRTTTPGRARSVP
ncbi:aldolase/citrate lyase family protein [Prauserella halophila]|uniref:Aldolase/citrate lyase family protein n=1 Tax=Prauserella halophila TaxID=185641 RepID=A0ABN1VUB3_9PSEU|nr:aldolase/citrate lyase family protein [Prauserella halophila]MCP2234536.1 Citrate lyase beta subunit [Prauserella halophila]